MTKPFVIKIAVMISIATMAVVAGVAYLYYRQIAIETEIQISPMLDYSLDISPSVNLNTSMISCLENANALTAIIENPISGRRYLDTQSLSYKSNYTFECYTISDSELTFRWQLDGRDISNQRNGVLSNLATGNHTLKLTIAHKNWSATAQTSFVITHINQVPVATITVPSDGSVFTRASYTPCSYNPQLTCAKVSLAGYATDVEDTNITAANLSWYSDLNGVRTNWGTGNNSTAYLQLYRGVTGGPIPTIYSLILEAKDSNGAIGSKTIKVTVQ